MADKVSKFFRVAVEGATSDGRTIERSWLTDAATSYNPETYAARVNLEHIRGVTADKPFRALGDVVALRTQEDEIDLGGKKQKKLALYAQIKPNDDLLAMNAGGQKLFTSIEISPSFADTKKAYLVGLAVTDSPASLGTQVLQFAAGAGAANPFANRKHHADNLIVEANEATMQFEDVAPAGGTDMQSLFAAAMAYFKGGPKEAPVTPPASATPPVDPANDNDARFTAFTSGIEKIQQGIEAGFTKLNGEMTTLASKVTTLETSIDTTAAPNGFKRNPAPGGGGDGPLAGMDW